MKVYFSPLYKLDNSKSLYCSPIKNNNQTTDSILKTDLANMPNYRYQINFGAMNDNLESLYKAYGQGKGMPETYDKVLSEMSSDERKSITNVYAHYRSIYAPLEECHSTEEIKKLFPAEFAKIQSALTRKSNNNSFIAKVSEWSSLFKDESDGFLFPETQDNDLAVYLAKKIFLEAKTKKEIKEDFLKEINREILDEQDIKKLLVTNRGTEIIPDSVFTLLGLQGKFEANGFRYSLLRSREDYIEKYGSVYHSKRKENFTKIVDTVISATDTIANTLPKKGSANYEKSQYAMFDVWNNSMDLKMAMSKFLTTKKVSDDKMLMPDLMSIHKDKSQTQRNLMQQFWAQNPKLREEFSEKCKDSFDKVEKDIDEGRFEELKKEIDEKRQISFQEMKALKDAREREIIEQQRIAKEKLIIEQVNNIIKEQIKNEVENDIRQYVPIPQSEISSTARYLSSTVKDANRPDKETLSRLCEDVMTVAADASEKSFWDFYRKRGMIDRTRQCLLDMVEELRPKLVNLSDEEILEFVRNKTMVLMNVLVCAYRKYLLFICNNSSKNPKIKARKNEMRKIIDNFLQNDEFGTKLEPEILKNLFREQAIEITEIPVQDVEKSYRGYYHSGIIELSNKEKQ